MQQKTEELKKTDVVRIDEVSMFGAQLRTSNLYCGMTKYNYTILHI